MVISVQWFILSDDFALDIDQPERPLFPLAGNLCPRVNIRQAPAVVDVQRRPEYLVALTEKRTFLPEKSLGVPKFNSVGVGLDLAEVGIDGKSGGQL